MNECLAVGCNESRLLEFFEPVQGFNRRFSISTTARDVAMTGDERLPVTKRLVRGLQFGESFRAITRSMHDAPHPEVRERKIRIPPKDSLESILRFRIAAAVMQFKTDIGQDG